MEQVPADDTCSATCPTASTADDLLAAAERSLGRLGGEVVGVVGWSLGATLAFELAQGAAALGTGPR